MSSDIKKKKKKKEEPRKANHILYSFCAGLGALYLKLFRGLKIDKSETRELKGPYLVVADHQSFVDFGAVALCCYPKHVNFVVSSHFFHKPLLGWFLPLMGCISRRQFVPDTASVRKMLRTVKRGDIIGIFPEGQTCCSGENNEIELSIGKLAKALKVPVVNVKIRGNYLTAPKWSDIGPFPGKTFAKSEIVLTAEELDSLTADEVGQRIADAVAYDEYEWQREARVKSRKKRSPMGLDKYLFRCPHCGSDLTMVSDKETLSCTACGTIVKMDEYGFLFSDSPEIPDTPSKWMRWQSEELRKDLDAGTLLPITTKVRFLESAVGQYSEDGYECTGEGTVVMDEEGMHYTGTRNGEPFTYDVSPKVQWNLTHSATLGAIDICYNSPEDRDFAFDLEDYHLLMKMIQAWPHIRKKFHN